MFGLNLWAPHTFKFKQLSISTIEQCSHYSKILAQIPNLCFYSLLTNWENRIKLLHNQRQKPTWQGNFKWESVASQGPFFLRFFLCALTKAGCGYVCIYTFNYFFLRKKSNRIDYNLTLQLNKLSYKELFSFIRT